VRRSNNPTRNDDKSIAVLSKEILKIFFIGLGSIGLFSLLFGIILAPCLLSEDLYRKNPDSNLATEVISG
jgi:penicillin-binding protein 1A